MYVICFTNIRLQSLELSYLVIQHSVHCARMSALIQLFSLHQDMCFVILVFTNILTSMDAVQLHIYQVLNNNLLEFTSIKTIKVVK